MISVRFKRVRDGNAGHGKVLGYLEVVVSCRSTIMICNFDRKVRTAEQMSTKTSGTEVHSVEG